MAKIRQPGGQADGGLGKLSSLVSMGTGIAQMAGGNPVGAIGVVGGAKGLQNKSEPAPVGDNAVQRRLNQMAPPQPKSDDILKTLQEGQVAFNQMAPEQRKEIAEPFYQTYANFAKDYKQGRFT